MPDEKDQGHLGAGENGMPRYGVVCDAEQQVLELAEGIVVFRANIKMEKNSFPYPPIYGKIGLIE